VSATFIVSIKFRRERKSLYQFQRVGLSASWSVGELVLGELDCRWLGLSASCPVTPSSASPAVSVLVSLEANSIGYASRYHSNPNIYQSYGHKQCPIFSTHGVVMTHRHRRRPRKKTGAGDSLFARLNNTITMPTLMKIWL